MLGHYSGHYSGHYNGHYNGHNNGHYTKMAKISPLPGPDAARTQAALLLCPDFEMFVL